MKVAVIQDAKILVPNKEHMNFTESKDIIPSGTELEGDIKVINGKRKGEEFNYRLFKTNNNQLIYLNKVKPMETTEVKMGADSSTTATVVKIPAEIKLFSKYSIVGALIGGGIGYAYSKSKKTNLKKSVAIGAAIGFGITKLLEHKTGILIKKK